MTRQWDTQAGREAIEKLRRDNAIMKAQLERFAEHDRGDVFRPAWRALQACAEPLTPSPASVLDDDGAVFESERFERESHHTPLVFPKVTDAEMDAIRAGCEQPELHGRTPSVEELAELEAGE